MKKLPAGWAFLLLHAFVAISSRAPAAEFATKIVDGLDRPVADVRIEVYWLRKEPDGEVKKADLLSLLSDGQGVAHGDYADNLIPADEERCFALSKDGYRGYSSSGDARRLVLLRTITANDVHRVAALDPAEMEQELRELLANGSDGMNRETADVVFFHARRLLPSLRSLASETRVGRSAIRLLAYIGLPEDLHLSFEHTPPPHADSFENRWKYDVVTAMLEPRSDAEWDFLKRCALGQDDDLWVDAGAIQTLRLIASPRSLRMLKEIRGKYVERDRLVPKAIAYIESDPAPLADRSLTKAATRVAQAIKAGTWRGNGQPFYDAGHEMALVDCVFVAGNDELTYTATFHHVGADWKLRGVRETMQRYFATVPNPQKGAGKKARAK